jgi:hypothetical protein
LVVIGVALEMVFVVWEYLEDLHDFNRGIVHAPDKPSWLLFALGFLGAALVAVGVGGELYAESKIATLETCIRNGNDALFLLLSHEADTTAERQFNRRLDSAKFVKLLSGKPKARAEVLYNPNDLEAWDFALDIYQWLGKGPSKTDTGAGWKVSPPKPIPANIVGIGNTLSNAPPAVRCGASGSQSGISFIAKDVSSQDSPLGSLSKALTLSIMPTSRGTSWMSTEDKALSGDLIIVVVGPKPSWLWGLQKWTEDKKQSDSKKQ